MAGPPETAELALVGVAPERAEAAPISLEPVVSFTAPDPLKYHPLTEDQIEVLCQGADDQSLNVALAGMGASAGLLQNVYDVIVAVIDGKAPTGRDLFLGFLCLLALGVAGAKITEWNRNKPLHAARKKRILARAVAGNS